MRDTLLAELRAQGDRMSDVAVGHVSDGDTIYRIDEKGEDVLFEECEAWGRETPFILVVEGVPGNGWRPFPASATVQDAEFFLIVDPIDGTREIMYDKRSAWALAAIAPNKGVATTLADVTMAVMTELPTTRHLFGDTLWAVRGEGAHAERQNLLTGEVQQYTPRPSRAAGVEHGFASITKFFPGCKTQAAQLEEALFEAVLGCGDGGNPLAFDDQYVSTGGQLYELIVGHDRFNADFRPIFLGPIPSGLCCHPYDICTELIAREAGVIVTDERGGLLASPLDIREPVSWIGYANQQIQAQLAPTLLRLLHEHAW
jgi:fructose-1,6-bisphosphatase/inositol monophosphatase family enzyme